MNIFSLFKRRTRERRRFFDAVWDHNGDNPRLIAECYRGQKKVRAQSEKHQRALQRSSLRFFQRVRILGCARDVLYHVLHGILNDDDFITFAHRPLRDYDKPWKDLPSYKAFLAIEAKLFGADIKPFIPEETRKKYYREKLQPAPGQISMFQGEDIPNGRDVKSVLLSSKKAKP